MKCTEPNCPNTAHVRYSWPWQKGGEEASCSEHMNTVQVRAQQLALTVPLQFMPIGGEEVEELRGENIALRAQVEGLQSANEQLRADISHQKAWLDTAGEQIDHLKAANSALTTALEHATRPTALERTPPATLPPEADESDVEPGQLPQMVVE